MLAGRLTNHKWNVLSMQNFKGLLELGGQARERAKWLTVRPPTTEPLLLGRVVFEPSVRRSDHQQASGQNPIADTIQKQGWVVKPVNQVASEHQVVAGVDRLEVAGIALHEQRPGNHFAELEPVE